MSYPTRPDGGPAVPVSIVSSGITDGGVAIPVYGYSNYPTDRAVIGMPARRVKILSASDLVQNGGEYTLQGIPYAMPVYTASDNAPIENGALLAVYPVNAWLDEPAEPAAPLNLLDNLVARWELNEVSGNRADSHTNAIHLTDVNTVTSAVGIGGVGTAASFNSAEDESFRWGDNANLTFAEQDFSFNAWVYLADKSVDRYVFSTYRKTNLSYNAATDRFVLGASCSVGHAFSVAADTFGSPPLNTWLMVTGHFVKAVGVSISVNAGVKDTTLWDAHDLIQQGGTWGGIGNDWIDFDLPWHGRIQFAGFWAKALGAEQALTDVQTTGLYNSGLGLPYASFT